MQTLLFEPAAAFRGSRDYVHSTDIYEEILAGARYHGIPLDCGFDLRILRKICCRPVYSFIKDGDVDTADAAAIALLPGSSWQVKITETAEPVLARKSYDEQKIFSASRIAGSRISLAEPVGMRPVEVATALSVNFHKSSFPPNPGTRWLLARLELSRLFRDEESDDLAIELERRVGKKMTRSRIVSADGAIGTLTFILA
ncbi:hypothetical protein [Bradyrhizobium acaciae]|uniref:hypothetical protein n=1 Tax=Bradyrhizobium acaciae TaxID=2683706 RepID=UPI001E5549A1|nr:hypothetical protein [Bradyrhizobium acaciae]MCC8980665.1 hypothetical protein [Bradyrhizobium acaciae]